MDIIGKTMQENILLFECSLCGDDKKVYLITDEMLDKIDCDHNFFKVHQREDRVIDNVQNVR